MKCNSSSISSNYNLKVVIAFTNFIGKHKSFLKINKKDQVLEILNIKVQSYRKILIKKYIKNWKNYLNLLRLIYR